MDQLDQLWNEYKFGGNEEAREKCGVSNNRKENTLK